MEFTLLWAVLTAAALAWLGLRWWPDRLPESAVDRMLGAGLAGLVAGRLTAMVSQGINPLTDPADVIIIRGGVHTGAAVVAFVAALLWSTRRHRPALDALAPAVLLGLAGWHGGCLWRGSCLGTRSDLPWAWALDAGAISRHPVEIYAALGLAIGAWWVSRLGWRPWWRAGTALTIAAGVRLVTEPLRPSISGGPVVWYVSGVVVGLLAAALGPRLLMARATSPT